VNTQTDLYAFGILFFELLTHKLPFPFLLSSDPQTQYKQLFDFHSGNGARELAQEIYYTGIPYVDGAGHIIGDCMQQYSANRPRNFRMLRETLENKFGLRPPDYLADDKSVNDNAYQRAISLREVQQFSEALSIFNSLLQQKPDDGRLWLEAAKTLSAMGQRDSAVKFLKQALHLDPTLEEADRLLEL
jgi:tetratricopeptide (TPR) repeat protein